jgi:integrase
MRYAVQSGLIDYNPAQEMAGAVASGNRQHRPALELKRIPELLQKIDGYTGRPLTRWATELTLLIFIRSSELRFARAGQRSILKRQCGPSRLSENLFPA